MDWVSGAVVYVVLWWWVLFMVLPFGVRRDAAVEAGNDAGAPRDSMIRRKLLITTALAAVLWVGVDLIIQSDLISFRDMIRDRWVDGKF